MSEAVTVDIDGFMTSLSNWGRWGDDDELGTLNLVDAAARQRGAALVTDGTAVSCAHDIRPEGPNAQRYMIGTGLGRQPGDESADRTGASDHGHASVAAEYLGFIYHGMTITHIDAPSHVFWDGRMYNGASASLVDDRHGATRCDVRVAQEGIVTRGVLVDIARLLGVDALEPGQPIHPEHLDAAVDAAGITIAAGDVLLVRTGEATRRRAVRSGYTGAVQPGLHAACLPWLRQHDIAALGSDVAQDVHPSGVPGHGMPIHTVGLVAMGLWLIDNCDLDELARNCAERNRWEFLFMLAPLRFRGATGSPVNPLAVF
ncbi:MAG: cyclase family protein [Ilumatobacteraceae bacterium]